MDSIRAGFKLAFSEKEQTLVYFDRSDCKLHIDYSKTSLKSYKYNKFIFDFMQYEYQAYQESKNFDIKNNKITLEIYVDENVLEVYINDTLSMSQRIYPSDAKSNQIAIYSEGGTALFQDINIYDMKEAF